MYQSSNIFKIHTSELQFESIKDLINEEKEIEKEYIWFTEINTPIGQFFECSLTKLQEYLKSIYGSDYNNLTKIHKIEPIKLNDKCSNIFKLINKQFYKRVY